MTPHPDIVYVLFTEAEIAKAVCDMGKRLRNYYADKNPVVVCTLKGAVTFFADLVRAMDCPVQFDFLQASSYHDGTTSGGCVQIKKDLETDIAGRHVILVEDIIDTGNTIACVKQVLLARNPASVRTVCLVDKPDRRTADIQSDDTCFCIPDAFIVGYGLDYAQRYRNLPYIGVLKESVYAK